MKSIDQIMNEVSCNGAKEWTDERLKEGFDKLMEEDAIFNTDDEVFKAIDEYVKKEAVAFASFIQKNNFEPSVWNSNCWIRSTLRCKDKFTAEELYSEYLKSKTNET